MKTSNNTDKPKRSNKIIKIVLIIILLLLAGYGIYHYMNNDKVEVKVVKTIKDYDYTLDDNETKIYNDTFDKLVKILKKDNVDYDEYAKCISELYVIDFYTLTNKLSKNDIGGSQFIEPTIKDNFIEKARSTFYKYLEVKSDKRVQELPEVSKIDFVTVENTSFTYTDRTVDKSAYKVSITWSYDKDYDYETTKNIILVKQDKKLVIVETNTK